jgi:hypothetical protein
MLVDRQSAESRIWKLHRYPNLGSTVGFFSLDDMTPQPRLQQPLRGLYSDPKPSREKRMENVNVAVCSSKMRGFSMAHRTAGP